MNQKAEKNRNKKLKGDIQQMHRMTTFKKKMSAGMVTALAIGMLASYSGTVDVYASETLDMSTDYPGITVKAGETTSFGLDFDSASSCDVNLSIVSIPEGWDGYFTGNSSQISKVHVQAGETQEDVATFSVTIPEDAEQGTYQVNLKADDGSGNADTLAIEISVNEVEIGQSSFSSEYPEQQGTSGTSFSFDTTLINNRADAQSYSLSAQFDTGWQVSFVPSDGSTSVASTTVEAGSSQGITVTVTPPETITEGEYEIPISAISANDTLTETLKVIITGSYDVQLTTSSGNLSLDAYSNSEKSVTLVVKNNGNVDLENINLTSSAATDWEVSFSESTIELLEAGSSKEITAYVTPSSDAMTGDYVVSMTASNDVTTSTAEFRVSVKTRTSWGVFAVAIIVVLVGGLGYIFKKYGRR